MSTEKIEIRAMIVEDFDEAAMIMTHGFRNQLRNLEKWSDEKVAKLLLLAKTFDETNLEGHFVATFKGRVVGVMHLNWLAQMKARKEPRLDLRKIVKEIGLGPLIVSSITLMMLDEKVTKDEMMVEFLAVSPEYRSKGIGKKLLAYGERKANERKEVSRYTVNVIGANEPAINLYKSIGFKVIKTCQHPISYRLTNVRSHYYMEKCLN